MSTDTDAKPSPAAAESSAVPASNNSSAPSEQVNLVAPAPAGEAAKPVELPRMIELPKPVEAAMKAAAAMNTADAIEAPVAPLEELAPPPMKEVPEDSRSSRFALLAASVAFAGALGAMAGALGTSVFARGSAEATVAEVDLTPVRDAIATLRTEIGAIKSSVETSNRNANAQLAKFNERLERIDKAQAVPAAQLKQAMDAIDRLEKRAAAPGQATGSVQQAAATPAAPAEATRQRVIDGWTVRQVSRGVAVIQGRVGAIEVEAGDVVPGVGRIQSIRRQDGRWVVLTSNGIIPSSTTAR